MTHEYNYLIRSSELFIREIINRNNHINDLNVQIEYLNTLQNKTNNLLENKCEQLDSITCSSSWKLTKPYRYIGGKIKKILSFNKK